MSAFRSATMFSRTLTTSARALNNTPKQKGVMEQAGEALKSVGQAFKVGRGVAVLIFVLRARTSFLGTRQ